MKSLRSALFVGDSTLLVRCGEAFLAAGHLVAGVITTDVRVGEWARRLGFNLITKSPGFEREAAALSFDFLFSVANLEMLGDELIKRARVLSLNFHDGPLPSYAGLNTPAWALMDGRRRYGVTWHEMTDVPDAGRIVASAEIEVAPNETAFSLNARCYEAGLSCFESILRQIETGDFELRPQQGERSYYSRSRRPSVAGTINFNQSADQVIALVRALQFGPYANPLGLPKLMIDGVLYFVGSAEEATEALPCNSPGDIVEVSRNSIVMATATRPVRLSGLQVAGAPVDCEVNLAEDARASYPSPSLAGYVDALNREAALAERFWLEKWADASCPELPYPRTTVANTGFHRVELSVATDASGLIAGLAAWLALITDQTQAAMLHRSADHDARLGEAAPWFDRWRPLRLELQQGGRISDLQRAAAQARRSLVTTGPIACDFRHRFSVGGRELPIPQIAIYEGEGDPEAPLGALLIAILRESRVELLIRRSSFDEATAGVIAEHVSAALSTDSAEWLCDMTLDCAQRIAQNAARSIGPALQAPDERIFDAISAKGKLTPERTAIQTRWSALTYEQLGERVERAAGGLVRFGVARGDVVAVSLERGPDLVIALLAIMKAGAVYLPLDPLHPSARADWILDNACVRCVIAESVAAKTGGDHVVTLDELEAATTNEVFPAVGATDCAYLIYTSGSTGRPKGVQVSHASLENLLVGMDDRIPVEDGDVWLSATSPAFDICLLELLWPLRRGLTVAVHRPVEMLKRPGPSFSLFYFAAGSGAGDPYKLLMEGAKFADNNGFEAIWTPERHFHAFGGPYPNPAITSAAVAAITRRVHVRAGSCVLPFHDPIRIAEDWALIDNISGGRTGVAFASGWNANDFVFAPDAFKDRKNRMAADVQKVRKLWRGESIVRVNGEDAPTEVKTLPRPVQRELPIWLTAARNPETFELAGKLGCNVLTHLLGMSFDELAGNITAYRAAWRKAGHAGEGRVTLMLHTFVAPTDDEARDAVRAPMKEYLRHAVDLVRSAAWSFPTFQQRAQHEGKTPAEIFDAAPLTEEESEAILDHAFERYYETSGLFGPPGRCIETIGMAARIGVDEIACLIDFGVPVEVAISHLPYLKQVMDGVVEIGRVVRHSVNEDVEHFSATHLQCTPSMATMILEAPTDAVADLRVLMIGGEALTPTLANRLRGYAPRARLMNMYGPTETTIWSTTCNIEDVDDIIPLGDPIANTTLRVAGEDGRERPSLVPGELLIGGRGLALGYWREPQLTDEKFLKVVSGERVYRTGDMVRRRADGRLEFLGRCDQQVKVLGHRVELGEIEAQLCAHPDVKQAAVIARKAAHGDIELAAYFTTLGAMDVDQDALRLWLMNWLPAATIPATFTELPSMPMTPNGKIDRSGLPEPAAPRKLSQASMLRGLEKTIAEIWSDLLGRAVIEPNQNFFDLGGHSLLAVQLQRRLSVELPTNPVSITDIFRFPTVRSLASFLHGSTQLEAPARGGVRRGQSRLAARRRIND